MGDRFIDILKNNCGSVIPMHMPGHKRNTALSGPGGYLERLAADLDLTEVTGFDDLHCPTGPILRSMEAAARLWGSERSYFLVNGSTCGILAGLLAGAGRGGAVAAARNCHRSVYNGLALLGAKTRFLYPEIEPLTGAYGAVTPGQAAEALDACPEARLLVLTSPTYEGVVSDVAGICREAHRRGVPVLVDEAHGAHFGFGHGFPDSAVHAGADIVVQSLHKTLPSLTQTAILHLSGGLVEPRQVENALSVFETSSPSYLLVASIDGCVRLLEEKGDALFEGWKQNLDLFAARTEGLRYLIIQNSAHIATTPLAPDPSKLVICTAKAGITGAELARLLRARHGIECEMASFRYAVAMTGMGDMAETLGKLAAALCAIDEALPGKTAVPETVYPPPMKAVMTPAEALSHEAEPLRPEAAAGRVSAEFIWAYPPGIPICVPGEAFGPEFPVLISAYAQSGVALRSTMGRLPGEIYAVK